MAVIENNTDEEQKGYTKEKADRLIKEHEDRAIEYERQAEEAKEAKAKKGETHGNPRTISLSSSFIASSLWASIIRSYWKTCGV